MSSYPRGSEWRKWDLHFHTPSSYDYRNNSITNEGIINALKAAAIAVVAVTDHHTMDVARIKRLQKLGGDEITILPGIELRTELGGGSPFTATAFFVRTLTSFTSGTKLRGSLPLFAGDIKEKGDEKVYVHFKEAAAALTQLKAECYEEQHDALGLTRSQPACCHDRSHPADRPQTEGQRDSCRWNREESGNDNRLDTQITH